MKKIYMLNNSQGVIGLFLGLKSRITSTKPLLTMLALLMVCLFGVNEEMWGADAWTSGDGSLYNNAWYAFRNTSYEVTVKDGKSHVLSLNAPCKSLSVNISRATAIASQSMILYYSNSTSGDSDWTKIGDCSDIAKNGSNYSFNSSKIPNTARRIKFQEDGGLVNKYINSVVAEMADPFVTPSATSLDFGSFEVGDENTTKTFTFLWNNNETSDKTLSITTDGTNVTLSPTSITATKGKFGTTETITATYTHGAESDLSDKYIYIKCGNTEYAKISLTGSTSLKQATMGWNSGTDFMNPGDEFADAAWSTDNSRPIKYSTSNSAAIKINEDGNLEAVAAGKATITAYQEANNTWAYCENPKDITVTNKQKQTISWTDKLTYKYTGSNISATMTATASSNQGITYSVNAEAASWITISGNTLTIKGTGTAYITATQSGGDDYVAVSLTRKLVSRNPNDGCVPYALEQGEFSVGVLGTKEFDLTGFPYQLTFKAYKTMATAIGSLIVEQKIGEEWSQVASIGVGEMNKNSYKDTPYGPFSVSESATKIRFYNEGSYDRYIKDVEITMASFLRTSVESIHFDAQAGARKTTTFTVDYSNIQAPLSISGNDDDLIEVSPEELGEDCGEFNTNQQITVVFKAGGAGNITGKNVTITDGKNLTKVIPVTATVSLNSQHITWNNTTTFLTTDSIELNATTSSSLSITSYTSKNTDVARINENNYIWFQKSSEGVDIDVYQEGNSSYQETTHTQNIVVNKVTPALTAPSAGTEIKYLQKLENSTIANDGEAKVTLRGVANTTVGGTFAWTNKDYQVVEDAGSHNYSVTFTPTDGGMYSAPTCVVPINIARATQAIEMNDGAVKVAVNGIDAGAADSKIALDGLIKSQTVDPVEASRAGVVTYEVISDNKANATIGEGNIFSATVIGDYTIRATKAKTDYYETATDEFVVSVSKRANTMTIAGTEYERFVDEEVTDIRDVQNSDATVQTSSTNENLAYYDVANNKIVIPNSNNQMFGASTTVTIKIWQEENECFLASGEKTITLTVKKYVTAFSGKDYDMLVDGTQTGEYVFTNTSAEAPTANSADDFYYTFENTSFDNEALNNGNDLATFEPGTKLITAKNAGATKIAFYQKETRKHTGATATYWITVAKHSNEFSCVWNDESTDWTKLMENNQNATVTITTNHTDYANYPISVEQTYGDEIATLSGTPALATIASTNEDGYAIWHLSQAENYKYYSAEADIVAAVGVPAPPTCYVLKDDTEHNFSTGVQLGVYDTPMAINAPADKIWFSAKRQWGGVNKFVAQYSVDNGTSWRDICNPSLDDSYNDYGPYSFKDLQSNEFVTHIRFGAKTGATLGKWYKNVKVSRKSYINIQNAGHEKIASLAMPTNTVGNETTAKFYIDYSTCDSELTIESSDPHFTVNRSKITVSGDNMNETTKEEVIVTYTSDAKDSHVGVITVSTTYQVAALSVSGVTNKRIQTIEWKEGFNTDPITLAVGTVVNDKNIAAEASSGNRVYYASSDASVIEIRNEGKEFAVVGEGTATLTVSAAGNEMWSDVSVTRTVNATEKDIQEIVWEQVFPRFMAINSEVDLDAKVYIRHGNERTYSAARSASLTYTCPLNNGVISVSGNKMTILAYGETTVTANVAGNEDYEAAAPMTVAVNVRQPSQGCQTPFVLEQEGTVSVLTNYSFSSYQYLESNSEILALDKTLKGKPDKLSFQYEGEEYKILGVPVLAGHVTAQQRIDGHWSNVSGSNVEPIKNEWKSIENLQLDERADAIRFYREAGGKGTHNFKDIKITRKQYLTASVEAINVGDIKMGQTKVVNVEFDYSDMKGDLAARAENTANGLTIANNGAIDVECGSFGHYQLPITIVPTQVGAWENTVYVKDPITNLEISVALTATILEADEKVVPIENGVWDNNTDVTGLGTNADASIDTDVVIQTDVTLNKLTVDEGVTVTIETGDVTVGSLTIEEGATVIVKSGNTLTIGDEDIKDEDAYGNLYVEDNATLILDAAAKLEVNNFTIESSIGTSDGSAVSGQVTNAETMSFANAYIEINMDPSGVMDDSKWYGFTVPFPVDVYEGVSRKEGDTYRQCVYGTHYMIAEYDANQRLNTGKGWKYITGNTLEPGKFYFFTVNGSWNTYRFKSKEATYTQPAAVSLTMNGEGPDANWCAVGNSMLQHVTANFSGSGYVQVYKNGLDAYLPVSISEAAFVVGCPFFIQATEETSLVLDATNSASAYYAPRRAQAHNGVARINLTPVDGGYSDQIYVSGTDKEQEGYVMGHDLSKAGLSKEVSQLWIANYGQKLSVNESAWCGRKAICPLGLYVPENGEYVLTATQPEDNTQIYLTKNGKAIWNLSMSEYTMSLDKGTDSSYGLMLVKAPKITTDTENIGTNGSEHVQKMILDDHVYILRNGEMFDAAGRKVK